MRKTNVETFYLHERGKRRGGNYRKRQMTFCWNSLAVDSVVLLRSPVRAPMRELR